MPDKQSSGRGMTLGERLREARQGLGLSTRVAALRLKPRVSISHGTLANYENDLSKPPIDVMSALAALYERPLNWFLASGPGLVGIRYRNLKSKVGVGDRHRFECECRRWLEAYAAIEAKLDAPLGRTLEFAVEPGEPPADAATRLRGKLDLDEDDRVESVVEILERLGVRTIEMDTDLAINGLAARMGDEHVVVLNSRVSPDRRRMDGGHELAHVVQGDCIAETSESKEEERAAFAFASHFLLTRAMLKEAFKRKSVVDLLKFKERFGISMAAMVYRGKEEGAITEAEAKGLWIEFAKRGWNRKEPGAVWADRATRFEAIIDSAIVAGRSTLSQLAGVAGVREDELRRRLALAIGADEANTEEHPAEHHRLRIVR